MQKKARVASLISNKIDLKIKKIARDNEGHYIMIQRSIQEEYITVVNIYAPNIGAPQYIRQTLTDIKGEIESKTIIVGDFNIPLTPMDRSSKQKINKETQVLNDTLGDMDLIGIFRTFHPNAEENTFSSAHRTFSRIDHIMCHKSNSSKFKKIESFIKHLFQPQCYETRYQSQEKKIVKNTNTFRLSNMFLNNQQFTEELKGKSKNS